MATQTKKFNPAWLLVIFVPLIFIIAIIAFLTSEDGYGQYPELNGWQALQLQWPGFWVWALIGLIAGSICGLLAYFNESGAGKLGKMLPGKTGLTIVLVILALGLICGPWGKACTDKTNSGVTAPKFENKAS